MGNIIYPLASSTWGIEEIEAIQDVIASDMYTMGSRVKQFEQEYADHFDHGHAIMCNSGSSANLLMLSLLKLKYKLSGDIIVPAVGWSTSYFPVNQNGFKLNFVDVDPHTYNIDTTKIASELGLQGPHTMTFWIKTENVGGGIFTVGQYGVGFGERAMWSSATDEFKVQSGALATEWFDMIYDSDYKWVHIALVDDGTEVKSVAVNEPRCMFCGNCYTMCPSMPLADTEGDGIVLMVGGKVSNRISAPKFSKVVVAFIPNEMPRWPSMTDTIKKMVEAYAKGANKYERLGEWAERIGWERFFEKCDLEFTHHLIDDFRDPAYFTWRQTSQFKF